MLVYFGPEVLVPLASAAAAVGGFFLLTWRKILGLFRRVLGKPPIEYDDEAEGQPVAEHEDSAV